LENQYNVRAVERSLIILELFKEANKPLSLTEISLQTDLSKTTALRLLTTLMEKGFIHFDEESKKYSLGFELFMLGQSLSQSLDIRNIAEPYLKELTVETKLIAHLGIYDNNHIVILEKVFPEGRHFQKMYSRVGAILPIHCTSLGKILISDKSDNEIRKTLEKYNFYPFTENTARNIDQFLDMIHEVRKSGYAMDNCEHEPYVKCMAVPVFKSKKNEMVASISLTGIKEEINNMDPKYVLENLCKAARAISSKIG